MMTQLSNNDINMETLTKTFDEKEVSVEKIAHVILKRLGVDSKFKPIIMYEEPFNFYIVTNDEGSELKLTAQDLLVACNSLDDEDSYFLNVEDLMKELKETLGGEPLELIAEELKKSTDILTCMKKV